MITGRTLRALIRNELMYDPSTISDFLFHAETHFIVITHASIHTATIEETQCAGLCVPRSQAIASSTSCGWLIGYCKGIQYVINTVHNSTMTSVQQRLRRRNALSFSNSVNVGWTISFSLLDPTHYNSLLVILSTPLRAHTPFSTQPTLVLELLKRLTLDTLR